MSDMNTGAAAPQDERDALEKWMIVDGDMRDPGDDRSGLITYHAAAFKEGLALARAALPAQAFAPQCSVCQDSGPSDQLGMCAECDAAIFDSGSGNKAKRRAAALAAPVQDVAPSDACWTPVISSNPMLNPYPLPNIGDVVLVTVDMYPGTSADIKNRYYTGEARWSEKGWSRVYRDPDVLHGGAQVIGWTNMPAPIGEAAQPTAQPADAQLQDPHRNLLAYVLQDDIHNRLTPRVIDIAYTAFMQAKQPNKEDGGPSDWFNDTKPAIVKAIDKLRRDLIDAARTQEGAAS